MKPSQNDRVGGVSQPFLKEKNNERWPQNNRVGGVSQCYNKFQTDIKIQKVCTQIPRSKKNLRADNLEKTLNI